MAIDVFTPAIGQIEPHGLFQTSRQRTVQDQSLRASGLTVAPGFQDVTLIASVPLSTTHWQPFAEGEIVVVSVGMVATQII